MAGPGARVTPTVVCGMKGMARGVSGAVAARGAGAQRKERLWVTRCWIKIPVLLLPDCRTLARDLTFLSFDFCI